MQSVDHEIGSDLREPRSERLGSVAVSDGHLALQKDVASVESGVSQSHAAHMFGVSRKTVGTWVRAYQVKGEEALRPRRRGRRTGEQLALSAAQQAWQQSRWT